ncbi:hypothetical protein ACLMJK_005445 [Lecanora helva]
MPPVFLRNTFATPRRLNQALAHRCISTAKSLRVEGDLGNPQSSSKEQAGVNTSRATKDQKSQDTGSLAEPVSGRSTIPGDKDEGTPTEDAMKRDPNEPAEKKRKSVEKQGEKPLGPEDHQ